MEVTMHSIQETIHHIARKYIKTNPITEPKYVMSLVDGVKRNHDFRYELNPEMIFPKVPNYHYVLVRGFLPRKEIGETSLFVNPKGPVWAYLNGEQVYESSLLEQSEPSTGLKFPVQTELENEILIVMKKTTIGIGATFGTGSVKGDPFILYQDLEEKLEGLQYSQPLAHLPSDFSGKVEELKEVVWLGEAVAETTSPADFFENNRGTYLYAKVLVEVVEEGPYTITGLDFETKSYLDGQEVEGHNIHLQSGNHQLLLK